MEAAAGDYLFQERACRGICRAVFSELATTYKSLSSAERAAFADEGKIGSVRHSMGNAAFGDVTRQVARALQNTGRWERAVAPTTHIGGWLFGVAKGRVVLPIDPPTL